MARTRAIWQVGFLALACSCNDPTAAGPPVTVIGTWVETGMVPGASFSLTLSQRDTAVTGTGDYSIEAGPAGTLTVSGSYRRPTLVLQIAYDFGPTGVYTASVADGSHLQGTFLPAGGLPYQLTLTRQ